MKVRILVAALLSLALAREASAVVIMLDIDSSEGDRGIVTQEGFTSYDAGTGPFDPEDRSPPEGSIVIDGVTLQLFGGLDGSRHRTTGGGGEFDSLLRDFVFNDGAGNAIGLRLIGLEPGIYDVTSWHYDGAANVPGTIQVEVRGSNPTLPSTVVRDAVPFSTDPVNYQITVSDPGQTIELIFREDDNLNRSRLNGIVIQTVPEPTAAGAILVGIFALGLRRRR